jgi:hypothetical protein
MQERKWVYGISSKEAFLMVKQIITLTQAAIDLHQYLIQLQSHGDCLFDLS